MQFDRNNPLTRFFLRRVVSFLLAVLLSLQLFALTQHHHDLATQSDHCPACNMANCLSGGAPTNPPPLLAIILSIAYWITIHPLPLIYIAPYRYLRPLPQAPPQA